MKSAHRHSQEEAVIVIAALVGATILVPIIAGVIQ
jgi:hypothetical protein